MSDKPYTCHHAQCDLSFARPSHLRRHQLTHAPSSDKRSISCSKCDRTFSRRDVLLRHLRTSHEEVGDARQQPRSAQKSCYRCVDKKIRCERTQPCRGCVVSRSSCEYPGSVLRPRRSLSQASGTGNESTEALLTAEHGHHQIHPEPLNILSDLAAADYSFRHSESGPVPVNQALHTPDSMSVDSGLAAVDASSHDRSMPSASSSTSNAMPAIVPQVANPDIYPSQFPGFLGSEGDGIATCATDGTDLSPSYFAMIQPDIRTNGFDWLDFEMPDLDFDPQRQLLQQQQPTLMPQMMLAAATTTGQPRPEMGHLANTYASDPKPVSKPTTAQCTPTMRPMASSHAPQLWPFDQAKDASSHRYLLPPLKQILQSANRSSQLPPGHHHDALVQLLSEQRLPRSDQLQSAEASQAFGTIQRLLDLYFTRFHDIQAIIHRPTWDMERSPTVLLTAMACVGALLSEDSRDTELCIVLSDMCLSMIIWLGASDDKNYQDIDFLNALCLHQIYSLGSGNRQLYQNADRSRGTLIGSLRGMGLLSSPWTTGDNGGDGEQDLPASGSSDLTKEWLTWIQVEQERRAAWAAFEYDCSLCTLTSRRGAVDLGELPSCLPCYENLWTATSAEAWLALRMRLGPANFAPSLSKVLKTALAGQEQGINLGHWAARLCGQVLGRLLWDIKQLEVVAMPHHLGLSSLIDGYQSSKRSILGALSSLLTLTANPLSTAGLITYNITGLLCHYSYLYAADDIMDVIIYIVRRTTQQTHPSGDVQIAQRRLRAAFAKDPRGARTLVWHAAQIVAIANEYLVSAPCEIMRLFMGYVFIMAYSTYAPRASGDRPEGGKPPVRLDVTVPASHTNREVMAWIEHGGSACIGKVADIHAEESACAVSQEAQAMMQKLLCWGLAGKFARILYTLGAKGL